MKPESSKKLETLLGKRKRLVAERDHLLAAVDTVIAHVRAVRKAKKR